MLGFNSSDITNSSASLVPLESVIDVGPALLDRIQFTSFRLVNRSDVDSGPVVVSIAGPQSSWFSLTRWNRSREPLASITIASVQAGRCSDTLWLRTLIPLSADLPSQPKAWIRAGDFGTCDIAVNPVSALTADVDPYPDYAGPETANSLELFATDAEAFQISLTRYDPLPVPSQAAFNATENRGQYRLTDRQAAAWVDRRNPRVGYVVNSSYRVKAFLGDRSPTFATSQTRLNHDYNYSDSFRLVLPPDQFLARIWAVFTPEEKAADGEIDKPAKYKRTVYLVDWQGERYAIDNVVPLWSFTGEILGFAADAILVQEPTGGNVHEFLPFNRLFRYKSHREIDVIESFHYSPDPTDEGSGGES